MRCTQRGTLIPGGARGALTLPTKTQENLTEAEELGGPRAGAGESLRLRVLQLNQLADAIPGRALSERLGEIRYKGSFVVPEG